MHEATFPVTAPQPARTVTAPSRLLSLDVLRGLTIGFMILVNDPGGPGAFAQLDHAAWNGFTATDLVFPTFLFVVGVSIVLSMVPRLERGAAKGELFMKIVRRTVLLILFGLLVNTFPFQHLDSIRFYGVLQRIGVCYFIVASLMLISRDWRDKVVLLVAALVGYWALVRFVPVPGYGVPTHTVPLLDRDGNLAAWIDRAVFSSRHLYERTRDPEGILSTIPSVGTTLIGALTGLWLRSRHTLVRKIQGVAGAGFAGVVLGLLWNTTFPLNKKMWTSSFVLYAGGLSLLLLALSMLLIDVPAAREPKRERSQRSPWFTPFLVFGTNAIAAYVLAELLSAALSSFHVGRGISVERFLYNPLQHAIPSAAWASLCFALSYVFVCWLVIYVLYRKKIFLKL